MNSFIRYPLVIGLVAAISGATLFATYEGTKKDIAKQELLAKKNALSKIFLDGYGAIEDIEVGKITVTKVWKSDEKTGKPNFYVTTGNGIGYNSAVPIKLLVGFTADKNATEHGRMLVGWSVIKSEETPGLGEKAKESAAPYTIIGKLTGKAGTPSKDNRTSFQKQFYNPTEDKTYAASELKVKKDGGTIDIITGATFSTRGIIAAIQDASRKIDEVVDN